MLPCTVLLDVVEFALEPARRAARGPLFRHGSLRKTQREKQQDGGNFHGFNDACVSDVETATTRGWSSVPDSRYIRALPDLTFKLSCLPAVPVI